MTPQQFTTPNGSRTLDNAHSVNRVDPSHPRHSAAQVPRHRIPLLLPGCLDSVVRYSRVEIHSSARRHGVDDLDIQHAVEHSLAIEDIGEDPDRWLVIGPDRAGNLLELVVLVDQRGEIVIHAMALRPKYRKLLEP